MKIVGGDWRGRRLVAPPGVDYRPTQGRVREALFSALGGRVAVGLVIDLYAGSGSLGLEALSRGADAAVFVEQAADALDALHANVASLGAERRAQIVRADVTRFLSGDCGQFAAVGLVLADPPYSADPGDLLLTIAASPALGWSAGGRIVLEHGCRSAAPRTPAGWRAWRPRRYGETCVAIAERECDE